MPIAEPCKAKRTIVFGVESPTSSNDQQHPIRAPGAQKRSAFVLSHVRLFSVWRMHSFHINEKIGCSCVHWSARFRSVGLQSGGTAGLKPVKIGVDKPPLVQKEDHIQTMVFS